ncbi:hypothetical protein JTE90_011218 [Oedothorax gibbosus]|uniref:BTB domain-containing protein n=1 Tax=Oedothorax gibbosus TaxID=931172 RepID=A0AAV6W1D5_9ARAC|nr:hypothetical protein JTE90_011218 [Oedothorax gibbosus]
MLPHKCGDGLTSAYFTTQIFDGTDFFLKLFPRGVNPSENSVSCVLYRKNTDAVPIQIGFSLTLLSNDGLGNKGFSLESVKLFTGKGYSNFVELGYLYGNKDHYLPRDVLTIKCQVWSPENKVTASQLEIENAFSSITRIQVNKNCVIWPIKNVEKLRTSKSKTSYHIKEALENIPSLELVFSMGDDSNEEYAQIDITQCSIKSEISSSISIFVKCKMTVMSVSEEYQHSQEDTFLFELNAPQTWHFPKFIAINNLKADKYIHMNDTLFIMCEFWFSSKGYPTFHEQRAALSHVLQMPHVPQASPLNNNIQKLYTSATLCDVELRVGNFTFPAHKVVLCAQSPVFLAMFSNDMKENSTNVIEIVDFRSPIIQMMVEFLHSDNIKDAERLQIEDICDLYSVADFYQILHLKQFCTRLLLSDMVQINGPYSVLRLADRYEDHFLMSCALHFIQTWGIEYFLSGDWKMFLDENPSLCGKVMIEVMKKV